MLRLAGKLAISNLVKNRRLYYPFALATCLVVAISY
ncbi:ABC transporter permease, partial [Streptococcus agalactiae]|nr:ABC transporter permease [Streptococcus agalactiae]